MVVLLNVSKEDKSFHETLQERLEQACRHTVEYFFFSFSAAVSERFDDYTQIAKMYQKSAVNLRYRFVFGQGHLITPEIAAHSNKSLASNFNFENEGRFMDAVRKGDVPQAKRILLVLFKELKDINYNDIMFYTNHLTNYLRNVICDINEGRQEPIHVSSILSSESLQQIETIDELYVRIDEIVDEIKTDVESGNSNEKQKMLAETIKEIIDTSYQNPSLSVTVIKDMLKLSSAYVGRTFNDCMKMSIPEYVSEVRMTKAAEWLKNSNLSVHEVMQKVGIENQSYFYKLFKKKYMQTPREYAQR